jgi:hypothetical protein
MGFFGKLILIAIICALAFWAYGNVKMDTLTVCVGENSTELDVTCVSNTDCVNYLTSLYGAYPDTPMYEFVLSQTTSCELGKCQQRDFAFDRVCEPGETPIVYKVTLEELWSKKSTRG